MLRNLITTTWRSMLKNGSSSLFNFIGLVLGFISVLIIGIYMYGELTYDKFHKKHDRIYRLTHNEKAGEIPGIRHLATVGPPVGPAIAANEQIEDAVRFRYSPDRIVRVGDKQFFENGVFYVDPSVFQVFTYPLLKGNEATALSLPNNIVLTGEMAQKYFGEEDPIGKIILMDNSTEFKVTGVLAPIPSNAHLKFNFLIPFEAFKVPYGYPVNLSSWGWISFHTYILAKPGVTKPDIENQLSHLVKTNWSEESAKKFNMEAQPLDDIYLGDVAHEQVANGNTTYLYVLSVATVLILVLVGFNFANLFTAISITRAKEIGVRKVLGAAKTFIARSIIFESIIIAIVAAITAALFLPIILRQLSSMGLDIPLTTSSLGIMAVSLVILSILVGTLSALYPSALLANLDNHQLLKGTFRTSKKGILVRRSLIFFQFCITITLISSVLIINRQIKFIESKDLGYAKDELLLLRMPAEALSTRFPAIQSVLSQNRDVTNISLGGGRLDGESGNVPIYVEGNLDEAIPMAIESATFDFLETIGVNLIAGREISIQQPADTLRGVLLNEAAMKAFGWTPDEAIGKKIRVGDIVTDGEVIGIVPDFNFGLLRDAVLPMVMYYPRTRLQDIYVRFNGNADLKILVSSLEKSWHSVAPEFPFDFVFLKEHLSSKYQSEKSFSVLFWGFAGIAILVSCLGLFALISQDIAFRVKEIGIRKVLGATIGNVTILIVRPFVILIVAANLIAWPLSWMAMQSWLNEFSFHTDITWSIFLIAGIGTLTISLLTVGYKTIRAGNENPVKSLRME